jgi:hypothetical protein
MWEAIKALVYMDNPCSFRHMKKAITDFMRNNTEAELVPPPAR